MRYTILVLAVALAAGATQARADLVTYNMTGTIYYVQGASNSLYAGGDHISWTVQYDRSIPMMSYGNYAPPSPIISSIIDQTTGYHFPTLSLSNMQSQINVSGSFPVSRFQASDTAVVNNQIYYAELALYANPTALTTVNLSELQLDTLPFVYGSSTTYTGYNSFFRYDYNDNYIREKAFYAYIDPLPNLHPTPEPGSLTLFFLGAAGLTTHGIRRRLRFRLVSFLAVAIAG